MTGSSEASNEFLDFCVEQADATGELHSVRFSGWQETVEEIESEILTLLAPKCSGLKTLAIKLMEQASEQVKWNLVTMMCDIISLKPYRLQELDLIESGFDDSVGDSIC